MKNNYRKILLIAGVTMLLSLTGCTSTIPVDTESDVLTTTTTTTTTTVSQNETSLDGTPMETAQTPVLEQKIEIPGEDFSLKAVYDFGDYDAGNWRYTDNKQIQMNLYTVGLPEGYTCLVEHMHADISLKSTYESVNGIKQDEMDDTYHGYSQDGFYINDAIPYNNIFSIEGYSDSFISGRLYYQMGYTEEVRITESKLEAYDVYAEEIRVIYDLLIKGPEDQYYRTKSISSSFLVSPEQ